MKGGRTMLTLLLILILIGLVVSLAVIIGIVISIGWIFIIPLLIDIAMIAIVVKAIKK